ncbi:hypothetical protein [uncultured Algoriphagus sp.]|uniref:hypothetical protein n=1 Tax=uncultured Algoriphagus sp. TaxID=417365 RepID=UPI0030EEB597
MQKTISIPKNLGHTKQLADQKSRQDLASAKKEVKEEVVEVKVTGRDLTQAILDEVFLDVKAHFQKLGKSMEVAILGDGIQIKEGTVYLEVMGHVQEELALKMKPEVIRIIKELASVNQFKLEVEVKEELESERNKLYTSTDKLNYLLKKHGALREFQQRFGLETDF